MNFFQRRKILKAVNYLDLVPVRMLEYKIMEDKVDLLLPRFQNNFWRNAYRNSKKGEHIYIHLDKKGSIIWQSIDGMIDVKGICNKMAREHEELFKPLDETETRVTQFLSLLYRERYISFTQILDKTVPD
ncbi:MAG: PqqD family protein [Bacteroidota bacterium]